MPVVGSLSRCWARSLAMRTVAGLTIIQGLAACVSGAFGHRRYVSKQLVIYMGTSIFLAALVGGAAAKYALSSTTGITRLRGTWAQFVHTDPPIPIMPTFHPAYLLRSYTPDNRKKVWGDLQAALAKMDG